MPAYNEFAIENGNVGFHVAMALVLTTENILVENRNKGKKAQSIAQKPSNICIRQRKFAETYRYMHVRTGMNAHVSGVRYGVFSFPVGRAFGVCHFIEYPSMDLLGGCAAIVKKSKVEGQNISALMSMMLRFNTEIRAVFLFLQTSVLDKPDNNGPQRQSSYDSRHQRPLFAFFSRIRRLPLRAQIRVSVLITLGARRNGRIGLRGLFNLADLNGVDHLDLSHLSLRRNLLRGPCPAANDNHSGHQDRTHPNFHENHPSNLQPTLFLTRGRNQRKSVPVSVKTTGMRFSSRPSVSARSAVGTLCPALFLWSGVAGDLRVCRALTRGLLTRYVPATILAGAGRINFYVSEPSMKTSASGAAPPRPDTPHIRAHYALTDDVHYELSQLFCALDMIADLAEGTPNDLGTELESRHYAPLFRTFAFYGHRLMADIPHTSDLNRSAA